jgi:hypothetical protein
MQVCTPKGGMHHNQWWCSFLQVVRKSNSAGQGCCVAKAMLAGRCNNCACSADGGSVHAKVCRAMPQLPLGYAFSNAMQCKHATNISIYMKCTQSQNMLVLADTIAHSNTRSSTPTQRAPASNMPGAKDAVQKPKSSKGLSTAHAMHLAHLVSLATFKSRCYHASIPRMTQAT